MKIKRRKWNDFDGKYLKKYTILFVALCLGVLAQFLLQGRSLVWKTDGASQYFPYLHYMGNYLRDSLEGLLHGQLPSMYDFALGMGDDLGAIIRWHPLDLISMAVPGKYTEILYVFLILFRLYLAGLSFSVFCFYWKKEQNAVLTGSMIYIFCGYVMTYGLRHPTFNAPLIILPLLLVGAEQVICGQNGLLFSVMTALGFASNYYFMYMCSVAMAGYVLLRFWNVYRENRVKNFFRMGIRLVLYYLLGIGMIAVVLFPTVWRLTTSLRLGGEEQSSMLLYKNLQRYYSWFMDLIAPFRNTGYNTALNYAVLVLPALCLLFVRRWKEHLTVKIALLLETVGLLIPGCAFVLSGFSSITNRWVFIFSFTLSFAVVTVAGDFAQMTRKQMAVLACVLALYCGLGFFYWTRQAGSVYWIYGMAELAVCTLVLLVCRKIRLSAKRWTAVLLFLTGCSCIVNGYFTYDEEHGAIASEYLDRGAAFSFYGTSDFTRFNTIGDDSFYRVDSNLVTSGNENASVILGYHGISMYNSIINGELVEYLLDQESPGVNAVHRVFSMDGRAASEALAGVKYYMTSEEDTGSVPYGFVLREDLSGESYKIYENQYPLSSLGYTYDRYISREEYDSLPALEKQQVMLEAVVLENINKETSLSAVSSGRDEILTASLEMPREGENVRATERGYKVGKGGGSITLTYEKKEGYEAYLHFTGFYKDTSYTSVKVISSGVSKSVMLRGDNRTYSLGRRDYLVNIGYCQENGEEEIEVFFTDKKEYELEGMEICYVPLDRYTENIEALKRDSLQNVQLGTNRISGTVSLPEEKFMVFSIPYSEGWTAYVDGEKAPLQKANVMYLGLVLEPGGHQIELRYCTPGFRAGAAVSGISLVIFLLLLWRWKRRRGCHIRV